MSSRENAVEVLLGTSNALWRHETRHEALLLLLSLYARAEDLREMLCERVIAGPPVGLFGSEVQQSHIDGYVFEILSSLRATKLPLSAAAQRRLQELNETYPLWKPSGHEGISHWMEAGWVGGREGGETIKSLDPDQVAKYIGSFKPKWGSSLRDLSESIGVRIAQEPEWGLRALEAISKNIANIPEESFNPILWGVRASLSDKSSKWDGERALQLIEMFGRLVRQLPSPAAWSSLPSVLNDLANSATIDATIWESICNSLQELFETFDFERSESETPVEWLQRSINHPYGNLTERYLKLAQDHVSALTASGEPLALEASAASFLARMSTRYGIGSRYGYCLTAQRLAWMEAVASSYAEVIRPWFNWDENEERALVAWSGYLWSRTLSRYLVEDMDRTYEQVARRHKRLARSERDGLGSHLAAIFWFHPELTPKLTRVASLVDSEIRLHILQGWKNHLQTAAPDVAASFVSRVLLPYWDWRARELGLSGSDRNLERRAFWELLPYTYSAFPEASVRARTLMPERSESFYLPLDHLVSDFMFDFPDELTELLLAWLELRPYPEMESKEWGELWPKLKAKHPKNLAKLENELARRGLTLP